MASFKQNLQNLPTPEKFAVVFFVVCMFFLCYTKLFNSKNTSSNPVKTSNCSNTEYYNKGLNDGKKWVKDGNPIAIDFPRGLTSPKDFEKHRFDVSFSGLKTSVARWVEREQSAGNKVIVNDVAASFQEAVVDVLLRKAIDACLSNEVNTLVIGGGVAANSRLRTVATQRCAEHKINLRIPSPKLCTDNGAMVAALGSELVRRGRTPSSLDFPASSAMSIKLPAAH